MPVQWGTNPAVSQSVFLLRGLLAARPAAAPANQDYYYLATDDNGGTLYQSDGSAWVQVAGAVDDPDVNTYAGLTDVDTTGQADHQVFAWDATAGKYQPLVGVVGDGAGGLVLTSGITISDEFADPAVASQIGGQTLFRGGDPGLNSDEVVLHVLQFGTLDANHPANCLEIRRQIDRAGHVVGSGLLRLLNFDDSNGDSPVPPGEPVLQVVDSSPNVVVEINAAGGLAMFGLTPPTVQPTGGAATAGAAYTATEQTMLQAVYDAARAIGLLS